MVSVKVETPANHITEDARWDYRVTIRYKNSTLATTANPEKELIRQLWPDQETYQREEQRRFEILMSHWDLPVTDITPKIVARNRAPAAGETSNLLLGHALLTALGLPPKRVEAIGVRELTQNPTIIQGGMGVAVSGWRLAHAVSSLGQLGVVSGTALDQVFARRLQNGDPGGDMWRGLEHFPFHEMAERVWSAYFIPGGKQAYESYRRMPLHSKESTRELQELLIVANFVEVILAKEGHQNPVGINYLEKIQLPLLPSIYGAMLAGVDYVLMGAGIPLKIPGVLDLLAHHEAVSYPMQVTGAQEGDDTMLTFAPRDFMEFDLAPLVRPKFLAIIASNTLATTMMKKANGKVDGFVVEGPTAGGHNAPPRGKLQLTEAGEPVYGERDRVDLAKLRELGVPFWLAGGYGSPEKVHEALAEGAAGVQVGTAFAYCEESGLTEEYKQAILEAVATGNAHVVTDRWPRPPVFPLKWCNWRDRYRRRRCIKIVPESATWGICARPTARRKARSIIDARVSRCRFMNRRAANWRIQSAGNAYATLCSRMWAIRRCAPAIWSRQA